MYFLVYSIIHLLAENVSFRLSNSTLVILHRSLMSLAEQITDGGRAKDMMSVFGFNETLDQLAVANSVHWYDHVLRREDGDVIWSSEEREDMEESSCGGKCEGWFEQVRRTLPINVDCWH